MLFRPAIALLALSSSSSTTSVQSFTSSGSSSIASTTPLAFVRGGALFHSSSSTAVAAAATATPGVPIETPTLLETPPPVTIDDGSMSAADKLTALRTRMQEANVDVWIVPTDDPHLSGEYSVYYTLLCSL